LNRACSCRLRLPASKFEDLNADGVKDVSEPALADWKIYLDTNANGQWDAGEQFDMTDSLGNYEFIGLADGVSVQTIVTSRIPEIAAYDQHNPNCPSNSVRCPSNPLEPAPRANIVLEQSAAIR
jgi:hypothetical protein